MNLVNSLENKNGMSLASRVRTSDTDADVGKQPKAAVQPSIALVENKVMMAVDLIHFTVLSRQIRVPIASSMVYSSGGMHRQQYRLVLRAMLLAQQSHVNKPVGEVAAAKRRLS